MADSQNTPAGDANPPSYLEMSDEDMLKATPPEALPAVEVGTTETAAADVVADAGETATDAADETGGTLDEVAAADESDADDKKDVKDEVLGEPKDPKTETKEVTPEAPKPDAEKVVETPAVDYEAEYKRLLAPFKANGREVQVNSVDDAVALMQMGANYNKKMAALKPNLKLMKMLENNGFLSEEKIGFLIDLGKKDPAAISKLVKDSGVDPMDLDAEKASAYKQSTYAVDDREMELDTVLDELQGTPTYTRTLDLVSNKWDVASKQAVSAAPRLLKLLNDHMASGVYDLISTGVERERMLGRLNGVSDIEAYKQIGDAIQARGGFNHLFAEQKTTPVKEAVVVQPKPKVEDAALKDKRRAASSTTAAAPTTAPKDFSPLNMSDEEFAKLATPKFS